jgi:hypothetical protein
MRLHLLDALVTTASPANDALGSPAKGLKAFCRPVLVETKVVMPMLSRSLPLR